MYLKVLLPAGRGQEQRRAKSLSIDTNVVNMFYTSNSESHPVFKLFSVQNYPIMSTRRKDIFIVIPRLSE